MRKNLFDQLSGIDGPQSMSGPFSFIEKGIKKAVKSVRKVTSKIAKKVLPSKIREIGRKLDKSGFNKIVGGIALAMVGVPALGGAGGIAAKGASIASKGLSIAKSGIGVAAKVGAAVAKSSIVKTVATTAVTTAANAAIQAKQMEAQAAVEASQQAAVKAAQTAQQLNSAMAQNTAFRDAVSQLRSEGYSDDEILQHWLESRTYYDAAVAQATQTVYPQVLQQVEAMGVPHSEAQDIATMESYNIAQKGVNQVKNELSGKSLLLPLGILALTFLG